MKRRACASTFARLHRDQRERTANATLPITVSHGISACPWNTTPRSSPGPDTSRPSMNTYPAEGRSSPASTLRIVVLPQPEWPTMQTNSPLAMPKSTPSKTVSSPRLEANRLARPSMRRNASLAMLTPSR